jgi:hypothetical protein
LAVRSATGDHDRPAFERSDASQLEVHVSEQLHPLAPHHLPGFITAPGETDVLMVAMAIFLILAVVAVGNFYLQLHTLPERMAHKSQKLQFEIVAVLGLLALFTHIHMFWIAGLLLAMIDLPDFSSPLQSIANSVERIAGGPVPDAEIVANEEAEEAESTPAVKRPEERETPASKSKVHGHA